MAARNSLESHLRSLFPDLQRTNSFTFSIRPQNRESLADLFARVIASIPFGYSVNLNMQGERVVVQENRENSWSTSFDVERLMQATHGSPTELNEALVQAGMRLEQLAARVEGLRDELRVLGEVQVLLRNIHASPTLDELVSRAKAEDSHLGEEFEAALSLERTVSEIGEENGSRLSDVE